jgi:hypothetical protein
MTHGQRNFAVEGEGVGSSKNQGRCDGTIREQKLDLLVPSGLGDD